MIRRFAIILAALLLTALPQSTEAQGGATAQGENLAGTVVTKEGGRPVEHAMITLLPVQRQLFSSQNGSFVFTRTQPGTYRLRVASLGFAPVEVTVVVPPSGAPPRQTVELTAVSFRLPTSVVSVKGSCKNPGPPSADIDADFAAVFGQLRQNAERYKLLADSFPFTYTFRRARSETNGGGQVLPGTVDTVTFNSRNAGWRYQVGNVVGMDKGEYTLRLPTLADFASSDFVDNHCFRFAGEEYTKEGRMLRIDFRAAEKIKTPDVDGTILLDAKSFQIRNASLSLTTLPTELYDVRSMDVETKFAEVAPGIVVFDEIVGSNYYKYRPEWRLISEAKEVQVRINLKWARGSLNSTLAPPQ